MVVRGGERCPSIFTAFLQPPRELRSSLYSSSWQNPCGFGESVFGPSPDVPRGMTSHTTCFCMVASARPDPPPIVSCWIAVLLTTLVSTGSKSPDDKQVSLRTINKHGRGDHRECHLGQDFDYVAMACNWPRPQPPARNAPSILAPSTSTRMVRRGQGDVPTRISATRISVTRISVTRIAVNLNNSRLWL